MLSLTQAWLGDPHGRVTFLPDPYTDYHKSLPAFTGVENSGVQIEQVFNVSTIKLSDARSTRTQDTLTGALTTVLPRQFD